MLMYMGEEEVIKKNMALAQEKVYTIETIESLPENIRAELIDGQLFYMASPSAAHQEILMFLAAVIWNHIHAHKGSCRVYPAPLAVYLNCDTRTYLEPDMIVVCDKNKMKSGGCYGLPDFVAEIVSPSTQSRDYLLKLHKYRDAGVKEYWILNQERNTIHVYDFQTETAEVYGFSDKVKMRIFEDLEVDFSELNVSIPYSSGVNS